MNNILKLDELLKYSKLTMVVSALTILVGLSAIVYRGGLLYGIDFTGGLKLEFEFTRPIDTGMLTDIRSYLKEDGSSVQVKTFSLPQEDENRGLMVTVRAQQLVTNLTNELYDRGRVGSESLFEEIVNLDTIRWIDVATLERNFRLGEGDSAKIDISRASREDIRGRVQSIVNETLTQEVMTQVRSSIGGSAEGVDLNWADRDEIEQWLETQQLNGLAEQLNQYMEESDPSSVSDLEPVLSRFNVEIAAFDEVFSIGQASRDQINILELNRENLTEIIREEFIQDRYGNVARDIVNAREEQGLFESTRDVYQLETMDGVHTEVLDGSAMVSPFVMIRSEMVSPSIGSELIGKSALAIFISLLGILIYLYIRFELTYSLGAIAAIIHDVAITIGLLTLLGVEFDVSVVAAVLTVIGYSLNDTIVNFDRVRENRSLMGYQAEWYDVVNRSIYEVLNRTMVTSLTTFIAVFVLYWYGGIALRAFSITLIIGIVVGTYSSIFVSNLSLYHLQKSLRST